ncbi:hypothetical protein [Alicyclobacillus shizuokensis]|nr:hypothetical protein [Alicyclobacillus shizuokensis]MCL6625844.1 hypothetical protein [Alicyclobacillus shizuokensis]
MRRTSTQHLDATESGGQVKAHAPRLVNIPFEVLAEPGPAGEQVAEGWQ